MNIKFIIPVFALISMVFIGCNDDLNELPPNPDVRTVDQALGANLNRYTAFLGKLYGGLAVSGPDGAGSSDIQGIDGGFGQYMRVYFMSQEVPTDEAILGWTNDDGVIDMSAGTFGPANPFIDAMYQRIMYQVAVCNEFLRQTESGLLNERGVSTDDQATIATYRAEARFLRALSYWHGLDIFGKMSFVTEADPVDPGFKPSEIAPADLFNYIESEALACTNDMAAANSLPYGRADKAAAYMLLAKLYLNAEVYIGADKYTECLAAVEQVINNTAYSFAEVPYSYLFLADNSTNGAQSEFIFPVVSDGVNLQSYGSTTFITHAAVGGDMNVDDFGIDSGWGGLRTRPEFVGKFVGSDSRAMFFTNGQTLDINVMGDFTNGFAIRKYSNLTSMSTPGSNATFVDIDFPLFRLSDAYLMYAECVAKGAGGSEAVALENLNKLRQRASATPFTTLDLNDIYDERARELYWEGHRRTDLIRQGKFTGNSYVWQWKGNTQAGSAISASNKRMPIPNNVLITNPNLSQNEGY